MSAKTGKEMYEEHVGPVRAKARPWSNMPPWLQEEWNRVAEKKAMEGPGALRYECKFDEVTQGGTHVGWGKNDATAKLIADALNAYQGRER